MIILLLVIIPWQAENDKLKAIMSEERRLKEANEKLLSNICNEVVKAAGSGNNSQPLDTVKQIISEHKVCGYDPKSGGVASSVL